MQHSNRKRSGRVAAVIGMVAVALLAGAPRPAGADGNEAPGAPLASRAISAGDEFTCAILADGSVRCWGTNSHGQLGLGDMRSRGGADDEMGVDLPPVDLGTGHTATAISAGTQHACAVLDDGAVKCWGRNLSARLGIPGGSRGDGPGEMGDQLPAVDLPQPAVAVSAGTGHTCAILADGSVRCWGLNDYGQLGLGDTDTRGDDPDEMGASLEPVALGAGRTATAVAAGFAHTCAVLDSGAVKCWGRNSTGQLGLQDIVHRGTSPTQMGDALPTVDLGVGRTATAIAAGPAMTCALLDHGDAKCWGFGQPSGALGQPGRQAAGTTLGSMGDALPPIDLGADRTALGISISEYDYSSSSPPHVCALLDDASVKCWGRNDQGELGLGDTVSRGYAENSMGDALATVDLTGGGGVVAVTVGALHTCALHTDATLKCWGVNDAGALGLGDTATRGDAAGEMGANLATVDLPSVGFLPEPAVNLVLSAVQQSTRTSEPIDYHVTVHNTGNATLTGVTITDPAAPDCAGPLPDLELGVRHTVACAYTPGVADVGTFSNTATVDTDQTDPVVSNQVDVAVAVRHQPDLAVKRAGSTFAGDGIYNNTGEGQEARAGRERGGHVDFVIRVGNDGDQPDTLDLRRVGPADPGLDIRYINVANGKDLTARIRAGTFHTRELAPGDSVAIRVEVDITNIAARQADHPIALRTRSGADPTRVDAIRATVRVN